MCSKDGEGSWRIGEGARRGRRCQDSQKEGRGCQERDLTLVPANHSYPSWEQSRECIRNLGEPRFQAHQCDGDRRKCMSDSPRVL